MIRELMMVGLLLTGCASLERDGEVLHETYVRYGKAVSEGSAVARRQEFFAPAILDDIQADSKTGRMILLFGENIVKESSHYERIESQRSCLTVNGRGHNGDPASLFIEYKGSGQSWLISSVKIYVQEQSEFSGFFEEALCPSEAQDKIESAFEKRMRSQ